MKTCTKCGDTKSVEDFSKNRKQADGLQTWCKQCRAEYQRTWQARNRSKCNAKAAAWRAKNKDRVAAYNAAWRAEHSGELAEYGREYREANKEKAAEYRATNRDRIATRSIEYQAENPHVGWAANYRRRARKFGFDPHVENFTGDDVWDRYGKACVYCGGPFEHLDHYVSVKNGGQHTLENVRPSCASCNLAKGDGTTPEIDTKESP